MAMVGGLLPFFVGSASPAADADLRPGQRVATRVLEILPNGDALLQFGQSRAAVRTSNPLQPGDRLLLEVVTAGPPPEFRMVSDAAAPPPAAAGQRLPAQVLVPNGDALLQFGQSRVAVRTNAPLPPGERVVLEVVTGGRKPEFRLVTDNTPATLLPAWPADVENGAARQRVAARVLDMLPSGDVLVQFGQSRAVVPTSTLLQPGQPVVLEVVTGGPTPEFRIVSDDAAPPPPLVAGQRLGARVIEMLASGDVLLQFNHGRVALSTSQPLQPGDRVALEVVAGGPAPEFRMVTDDAPGSQAVAGQRVAARVLEALPGGDVVVGFGQNRAVVHTVNPPSAGERVVLEVVTGGPTPEFRIVSDTTAGTPQPAAGQRLAARALEVLPGGDVLLDLGHSRAAVRTNNAVQPGDRVVLEAVTGGPTPQFRIVTDETAATPQPAAGQRVAAGVLEMQPREDAPIQIGQGRTVGRTFAAVQTSNGVVLDAATGGSSTEFRVVSNTPASAPPGGPVDDQNRVPAQPAGTDDVQAASRLSARDLPVIMRALADVVPTGVPAADSGQEFLRAATASHLRPVVVDQIQRLLAPLQAALPPEALATMIRTFLAQSGLFTEHHLRQALKKGARMLAANHEHTGSDVRLLLGGLTSGGERVPDAVRSFGDALLQQQLALADRLAATGVGQITMPFLFGDTRVDVVVEWERKPHREKRDRTNEAVSLGVFVHLKALGAIEARLEWQPESLAVTFFVERESTRAIVEAGLDEFSKHLCLSGCPAVTSHVFLNPDRTSPASVPAAGATPGGTILDVMV